MDNDEILEFETKNHYYANISLTHLDTLKKGFSKTVLMLIDCGADYSRLPCTEYWNYDEQKFDYPDISDITSSEMNISIDSNTSEYLFDINNCVENWQNCVGLVETSTANGVGQIIPIVVIYLKNPLYISVNKLIPKPIYKFFIGLDETQQLMPLLGLDGLDQYKFHSVYIKGVKTLIFEEPKDYDEWNEL